MNLPIFPTADPPNINKMDDTTNVDGFRRNNKYSPIKINRMDKRRSVLYSYGYR